MWLLRSVAVHTAAVGLREPWQIRDCGLDSGREALARLDELGTIRRNDPISGPGGTQVVIEDPSGNPIELFTPRS